MTNNEIIKAKSLLKKLEEAYEAYYDTSKGMPYDIDETLRGTAICLENALNEINQQKAEIERLNDLLKRNKRHCDRIRMITTETAKKIKTEAIKEFAERLKEKANKTTWICKGELVVMEYDISRENLDNLVKEMVGDTE